MRLKPRKDGQGAELRVSTEKKKCYLNLIPETTKKLLYFEESIFPSPTTITFPYPTNLTFEFMAMHNKLI